MMKICTAHQDTRPTPLIFTLSFRGSELWCAHCGRNGGLLGAGDSVEATPELEARLEADEQRAAAYLRAKGRQYAVSTKHNGEWIKPADLPAEAKAEDARAIAEWTYECREISRQAERMSSSGDGAVCW